MKKQITITLILFLIATVAFVSVPEANCAGSATIRLVPSTSTLNNSLIGQEITVNITIENVQKLSIWAANIKWDPTVLNFTKAVQGSFLTSVGSTFFPFASSLDAYSRGEIPEVSSALLSTSSANGSGTLLAMTFKVLSAKTTEIKLNVTTLGEPSDPSSDEPLGYNPPIAHTDYGVTLTAETSSPTPGTSTTPAASPSEIPTESPATSPTVAPSATNSPLPAGTQSPNYSATPTNTDSPSGLSTDILIIVGAGAVVAVVVGLGAFMQRRKQ